MHIIFGKENAELASKKYTVLELDTFRFGTDGPEITAYCTVENIPLDEFSNLVETIAQHQHLLINYRGRAWNDCLIGIDQLMGKWRGELDTFYDDLRTRVQNNMSNSPGANWSPVIQK